MSTAPRSRSIPVWVIPVVLITVAAAVIWAILQNNGGTSADPTSPPPTPTDPSEAPAPPTTVQGPEDPNFDDMARRDEADPLTAGPIDAPVALVVYSDYQCVYCAKWSNDTLPQMLEFAENGDLRIEWRDVNIFGPDSERAARAAYAAALQDTYWEYHEALYPNGETLPADKLTDDALTTLATELGLDTAQFTADLNSPETLAAITANQQEGLDLGAYSTPSFILGGQPIVGAQPTDVFLDAYEAALAAAG